MYLMIFLVCLNDNQIQAQKLTVEREISFKDCIKHPFVISLIFLAFVIGVIIAVIGVMLSQNFFRKSKLVVVF